MSQPNACTSCLRRTWLMALLGAYIERAVGSLGSGRVSELLRLTNEELVDAVAPKASAQLLGRIQGIPESQFHEDLESAQCWACCRHDERYPDHLRSVIKNAPALIGRGDVGLFSELEPSGAVAVVGARRATAYGREMARELGRELASAGVTVISGLAFGVDACAQRAALDAGHTIAVLGCGPDIAYPASHQSLWKRICEQDLVLAELPPGATPWRWTFPARNRIVAGLTGMTVVVEAAAQSGSLVTANFASEFGREVGAVPGPVTSRVSAGPNALLAAGAHIVRDARDVLDELIGPEAASDRLSSGAPLNDHLAAVLRAVEAGPVSVDEVAGAFRISAEDAAKALSWLEANGHVSCSAVGVYSVVPRRRA